MRATEESETYCSSGYCLTIADRSVYWARWDEWLTVCAHHAMMLEVAA